MDCSSASAYTRLTLNWSGAPSAPATATSFSVSSSVQGLKSTAPMRTARPSCALAIFSPCHFSSGGSPSQPSAQSPSRPAPAYRPRRTQRLAGSRRLGRGGGTAGSDSEMAGLEDCGWPDMTDGIVASAHQRGRRGGGDKATNRKRHPLLQPETRKPGVSACSLPAGLSGSVTKASWSAWVRIGKLAVSGCGEGKGLPSRWG